MQTNRVLVHWHTEKGVAEGDRIVFGTSGAPLLDLAQSAILSVGPHRKMCVYRGNGVLRRGAPWRWNPSLQRRVKGWGCERTLVGSTGAFWSYFNGLRILNEARVLLVSGPQIRGALFECRDVPDIAHIAILCFLPL
ncbi:unnamed protein product [Lota lota]